ncbi:hypothetical protein Q3O97_05560 [Ralstonia pseudosolanacearum]|uniref:hypothetical protein n=1 Tax=Ralstonia pseudosolanacearum TaxID=1310165 RepID=UPI002706F013|nr:hypothetical protein [Ralstonia pseudosolanacearum]MDO3615304.1 hypothetical protein [Ralstonia pseudosolanacearum]
MVRTLVASEATLGRLGAHVTGAPLPVPLLAPPLTPTAPRAVPLEAMRLPALLDGSAGVNRGEPKRCRITAGNDYAAIQTWLSLWPAGSSTWRAYRAFLATPERGPRWSGPPVARHLPGWRPFQGALAPRTRACAE